MRKSVITKISTDNSKGKLHFFDFMWKHIRLCIWYEFEGPLRCKIPLQMKFNLMICENCEFWR